MKTSKIIAKATELKEKGFTHMASIVKSTFKSSYFHVVKIDDILESGKWIPANKVTFQSGAHGRIGILGNKIDWAKTARK